MNEAVFTETDYERLRPHLLDALAKLARQGFTVTPWDGIDLIHDFFLEAWNGVNSRFDPSKGTFNAYVYGAFVHFARPRIVKLQRLQSSLVEPEQLDLMYGRKEEEDDDQYLPPEDSKEIVREAISRLPPREREILSRYLYSKPRAERMLARRFSMSRYGLRQVLIDTLGRIIVRLEKPGSMPERDWKVAVALWRETRTIDETAVYLGLTTHQVREANSRNVHLLTEALKYYHPHGRGQLRRNTMTKPQRNLLSPHDLLERVLKSPGNEELLEQVRESADEVLAALENSEFLGLSENEIQEVDPLWVAQVYEALNTASAHENEDSEAIKTFLYANQEEEISIGSAFSETLMAGLPRELKEIDKWFQSAPQVDMEERRELMKDSSVLAGRPYTEKLIPYGVTPVTVFYTTEAVSSLLNRLVRYEMLHPEAPVLLGMNRVEVWGSDSNPLSLELVVDEIERVTERSEVTARALYGWSVKAAQYKHFLFRGFQASPREEGVSLIRTDEIYDNLYERWARKAVFETVKA